MADSFLQEYKNGLTSIQLRRLKECTSRASEIVREKDGVFTNAPDAARQALLEVRIVEQRKGARLASSERIDLATRLICSELGLRAAFRRGKKRRGKKKPEQKRLNF